MAQQINPLRKVAESPLSVQGGSSNLVANGIYSVDDIVNPILTESQTQGDPRIYAANSERKSTVGWRKVNRDGWISPKRKAQGDQDTVVQIKYAQPKRLNQISFEVLRVPQTFRVLYYDDTRRQMVEMTDIRGQRVAGVLTGLRVDVTKPNRDSDVRKWRAFSYSLPTIKTNLIEIHANRKTTDEFFDLSKDTPYSLGFRNVAVHLNITEDDDSLDPDEGTPTPIGTVERPKVVRYTSTKGHDSNDITYWECAPQGAANSVVPYYVDMRLDDGSASIFDQVLLRPLWTGPNMSMYWSNDDVTTPWEVSANRVNVQANGIAASFAKGSGVSVDDIDASWGVANDYMKLDLDQSFVVGVLFEPTDTNTAGNRYLWSFASASEELSLRFVPTANGAGTMSGNFEIALESGGSSVLFASSNLFDLDVDTKYGVVLGYTKDTTDPTSLQGWHLSVAMQPATGVDIISEADDTTPLEGFFPTSMVIGSNVDEDSPMLGYISRLWVRMDPWSTAATNSYLKGPDSFTNGEGDTTQRVNGLYSGVLVAPLYTDTEARIGPGAGFYRNKEWTPILNDFILQADSYSIPVTTAKFLKLEFTNLTPRTYLTEQAELPVRSFPQDVINYYRDTTRPAQTGPYTLAGGREYYEVGPQPRTPGDPRIMPDVRGAIDSGNGTAPGTIYHADMGSTNLATSPDSFDSVTRYQDLQFATTPMRFYATGRHEYDISFVQADQRAFFVGITELTISRTDHSVQFDSREYTETYDDDLYIASSTNWTVAGQGVYRATASGADIVGETMESYSNFETVQMAVVDAGWESGLTDAQIDFGTIAHLVDTDDDPLASSATSTYTTVTGQYQGARGGNVLRVDRLAGYVGRYGLRTDTGTYIDTLTEDGGARTSAVARVQLPTTNAGSYELRLYANGDLVASKAIITPVKKWTEVELVYLSRAGDTDWQVEVVQTNGAITEPLVIDMMGIWQNAVSWQISNDDGGSYQTVIWPLNRARGYIRFPAADFRLKVKATSLRLGAVVSAWQVVPWYIESSMVMRAPIDYNPPWGASDQLDLLDTTHKPLFRVWSHYFPQRFSVDLFGFI